MSQGYCPGVIAPACLCMAFGHECLFYACYFQGACRWQASPFLATRSLQAEAHRRAPRILRGDRQANEAQFFSTATQIHTAEALIHSTIRYTAPNVPQTAGKNVDVRDGIRTLDTRKTHGCPFRSCFENQNDRICSLIHSMRSIWHSSFSDAALSPSLALFSLMRSCCGMEVKLLSWKTDEKHQESS